MTSRTWQRLLAALPDHQQRIERRRLAGLAREFASWRRQEAVRGDAEDMALHRFLVDRLGGSLATLGRHRRQHAEFLRHLGQARAEAADTAPQLLQYAADLGATGRRLAGDRRALGRWFGADALHDRFHRLCSGVERDICLALQLIGLHSRALLEALPASERAGRWRQLDCVAALAPCFAHEGNPRLHLEAFRALGAGLRALPAAEHGEAVPPATSQYIYRLALEPRQDVWLQCEALSLLDEISPEHFLQVAERRLGHPADGDDLFVRRHCVALLGARLERGEAWRRLLARAAGDPRPYVRQQVARQLAAAPAPLVLDCLPRLLHDDVEPAVRAQAVLALRELRPVLGGDWLATRLMQVLEAEADAFVLRCALLVAEQGAAAALAADPAGAAAWGATLRARIDRLACSAADLRVRRWAAETAEWLGLQLDAQARAWLPRLARAVRDCPPGRWRRLPAEFDALPAERLGRIAQVLARRDFGLQFERRRHWRMHRGDRFAFRSWRWLHEFRHPSPDKRQAFRHTIGRVFRGGVHAPSAILAELSETKVPGEPLHLAGEGGWRPYLPLPDQLISAVDEPRRTGPVHIHTAAGITEVATPHSLAGRLRARLALTWRFAEFARLRNWHADGPLPADSYVRSLEHIGIRLRFSPYPDRGADPSVQRFFAVGLPIGDLWPRLSQYFFSAYENTLFDLVVFITAALGIFTSRHLLANLALRRARAAIPLVVGGWGTRGKSGTERLKAALFNGLGYGVVSKTTGCEAMFLHGPAFRPLREMFLFRPYDKATIWEQHQVTGLAARLEADVLLWECMALTPAFVGLLQKRWMRDDIATITNTFPDHEDIQGPAGIDIPQVMTHFIPDGSLLLTSEEHMRPILAEAARAAGTELVGVGWLEAGLLTPDILARFPYQEHRDNIALVLQLARTLGVPEDFALREMADRVVPDLGVLKVYPLAEVAGRRLSFANGMSANERFGCLSNWRRLGFDQCAAADFPDTLVSTVVNNRADRVARSRVFAAVLVEDIEADRHFLIGTNLQGLRGYIREAWAEHAAALTLAPASGEAAEAVFAAQARRLRQPTEASRIQARLRAMLGDCAGADQALGQWREPAAVRRTLDGAGHGQVDEIVHFLEQDLAAHDEYQDFLARIRRAGADGVAGLDEDFRALLWRWFERKLTVIDDAHASGDQIIRIIAGQTPPRCLNRIMGIQNIKGTGLDFVYRWQAWERCHRACRQLASGERRVVRQGLAELATFQEFGLLTETALRQAIATAQASPVAQNEQIRADLQVLRSRLDLAMEALQAELATVRSHGLLERLILAVEGFLDAGDAMWRRKRANRIYQDLADQRIAADRAVAELLALTQRQKGGWLYRACSDWWRRIRGRRD